MHVPRCVGTAIRGNFVAVLVILSRQGCAQLPVFHSSLMTSTHIQAGPTSHNTENLSTLWRNSRSRNFGPRQSLFARMSQSVVAIAVPSFAMAQDERGKEFVVRPRSGCDPIPFPVIDACTLAVVLCQVYVVTIRLGGYYWTIYRRFSQFKELSEQVSDHVSRWVGGILDWQTWEGRDLTSLLCFPSSSRKSQVYPVAHQRGCWVISPLRSWIRAVGSAFPCMPRLCSAPNVTMFDIRLQLATNEHVCKCPEFHTFLRDQANVSAECVARPVDQWCHACCAAGCAAWIDAHPNVPHHGTNTWLLRCTGVVPGLKISRLRAGAPSADTHRSPTCFRVPWPWSSRRYANSYISSRTGVHSGPGRHRKSRGHEGLHAVEGVG
jgi:hypothetical protein